MNRTALTMLVFAALVATGCVDKTDPRPAPSRTFEPVIDPDTGLPETGMFSGAIRYCNSEEGRQDPNCRRNVNND